ncbi:MAG: amidohydrolase family protein, partial [Chitinivibrionales bacterium]|nr:amidohydrolase family protein [Chitinivibrionales bacterium]
MADLTIYNIHTHFFTSSAVPRCFLPLHSLSLLCRQPFTNRIARILNGLCPYSSDDLLERYGRFTSIGNRSSQEEIFKLISGLYPYGTRFAVLTMDMAFMGAGPVRQDLPQQVEELGRLTRKYPDRIIPFVAVDPRRPDRLDIVKYGCDEFGFRGIKIYPALGFLPYDTRLEAVYRYCIDHGLQVFTHASPNGIHYRGKVTPEMVAGSRIPSHFADS